MKALNYCCKALLLRCLGESWIRYTSEKFTQSAYCFLGNISKVEHSFFVFYYLPIKYILTETLKLRESEKKIKNMYRDSCMSSPHIFNILMIFTMHPWVLLWSILFMFATSYFKTIVRLYGREKRQFAWFFYSDLQKICKTIQLFVWKFVDKFNLMRQRGNLRCLIIV